MNSYLIWLPSIQEYKRFKEYTTKHQRILSKVQGEPIEFVYHLNTMINELCEDDLDLKELTILDKYIICLYLRMRCVGPDIPLSISCPKCNKQFSHNLDLDMFIQKGAAILDRNFERTLTIGPYSVTCDIPKLFNEYEIMETMENKHIEEDSLDRNFSYNTISHIKTLKIKEEIINFSEMNVEDCIKIFNQLPSDLFLMIQNQFIEPLSNTVNPDMVNIPCKTKDCQEIINMQFNIYTINDILKILFQESPTNLLREICYLSRNYNLEGTYVDELTPVERDYLVTSLNKEQESMQQDQENEDNMKQEFMSDYGFGSMEESPSEFANIDNSL